MVRRDFQCVFCFLLLAGDQCSWAEISKNPTELGSDGKIEEFEEMSGVESGMNTHFHRIPPPSGHMVPPQSPPVHLLSPQNPPHHATHFPGEFYPYPQRYYPSYNRNPEDETLQEMKQTMATISGMQKQFMNTLRTLQDSQNSPPIVEQHGNEEDSYTRIPKDTQVNSIKDVLGRVTRRKKPRPATTTTVVQTVPQPIQTPTTALQSLNVNTNGLRNFLDRTLSISHAEKTFDMIKSDMFDALWTGVIVIAVKMAPLILMCIRLIFKALLPLVGMSLLNRSSADARSLLLPSDAPRVFLPFITQDTTTTVQQDVEVEEDQNLDDEFENIKRNFYR